MLLRGCTADGRFFTEYLCRVQVVASFLALLGRAAGGADPSALAAADWAAVPATLPTIALAFVYQNVVPVIASSLEVPRQTATLLVQSSAVHADGHRIACSLDG